MSKSERIDMSRNEQLDSQVAQYIGQLLSTVQVPISEVNNVSTAINWLGAFVQNEPEPEAEPEEPAS